MEFNDLIQAFGDEPEFGLLKKQVVKLRHDNEESRKEIAPMAKGEQARIQRSVAYDESRSQMGKWSQKVMKNREEKLSFPQRQVETEEVIEITTLSLDKIASKVNDILKKSTIEEQITMELPFNILDKERVEARHKELRYLRELAFRHEVKAKRVAKIKSKSYRKILRSEKMRQSALEFEEKLRDPEALKQLQLDMERDRARERLTLKSKAKLTQFEQKKVEHETQNEVLNQITEREMLKKRIHGASEEVIEVPEKGLFAMKFMKRSRKESATKPEINELTGDLLVPRQKIGNVIQIKMDIPKVEVVGFNRELVNVAFKDDYVMEFEKEKQQVENLDAPHTIDETLPGWGAWAGEDIEHKNVVIKHVDGIKRKDRKDYGLKHVIISEEQPVYLNRYLCDRIPHPFNSHEQFLETQKLTIGPEWTTNQSLKRVIAPMIQTTAGNEIKPLE